MIKKRSKNELKRQQILDAAIELFSKHGYANASMDEIAKNADVSKQTVYSHFGNKDGLFSASIAHKCESLNILDIALGDSSNPHELLLNLARRFSQMITSKEACAVHKICAFESKSYPQVSKIFYQSGPLKVIKEVSKLMERLHQEKFLTIENPWHASLQFLNIMKGELWMQFEFNLKEKTSNKDVDEYLRSSVDFFIRGYTK